MPAAGSHGPLPFPAGPSAHPFHVMAKPGGAGCNLECSYCYYLEKSALYPGRGFPRMSEAVLEAYVRNLIASHPPGAEVVFAWQGGEPALLGLDFYRHGVALQRRHGAGRPIVNTFQSNATLLDDAWARFFAAEGFLLGVSLDGPADLHDRGRRHAGGKPSHGAALRGLERLLAHGVPVNLLACVSAFNAEEPRRVYEFLRDHGAAGGGSEGGAFLQFIPVLELDRDGQPTPWSVGAEDYGRFMVEVFECWRRGDVGRVTVMNIEWALANYLGLPGAVCHHQPLCGRSLAVERNGDVYACDHFVDAAHRLGNATQTPFAALVDGPAQQAFARAKYDTLAAECRRCEVLEHCWGGCPKHRCAWTGRNRLCAGYRHFFRHLAPYLRAMAAQLGPAA